MVEHVRNVEIGILVLLVRKHDVEADGEAAAFLAAAVRSFHHSGAAARDDAPAGLAEAPAGRARVLVGLASLVDTRRAEQRDRRPVDQRDLLEAGAELLRDLRDRRVDGRRALVEDLRVVGHKRCCGLYVAIMPRISIAAVPK